MDWIGHSPGPGSGVIWKLPHIFIHLICFRSLRYITMDIRLSNNNFFSWPKNIFLYLGSRKGRYDFFRKHDYITRNRELGKKVKDGAKQTDENRSQPPDGSNKGDTRLTLDVSNHRCQNVKQRWLPPVHDRTRERKKLIHQSEMSLQT